MRSDVYRAFRFGVERRKTEIGGFSHVSGLTRETTFEEYREGGRNGFVHKLANVTKFTNLVLKRGLTGTDDLWRWHQDVIEGRIAPDDLDVVLRGEDGRDVWRWSITAAYPVKWVGTDFDASQESVFVETIVFVHQGVIGRAV
jgi:phage tail-like protein